MKLNEYQNAAQATALYPDAPGCVGLVYTTLGLTGEAGEIANKVKKILRDDNGVLTTEKMIELGAELGDVLWYVAMVAEELGFDLETLAHSNLTKLKNRQVNGTLQGSGDTR